MGIKQEEIDAVRVIIEKEDENSSSSSSTTTAFPYIIPILDIRAFTPILDMSR